jgi:hypothetical protein
LLALKNESTMPIVLIGQLNPRCDALEVVIMLRSCALGTKQNSMAEKGS